MNKAVILFGLIVLTVIVAGCEGVEYTIETSTQQQEEQVELTIEEQGEIRDAGEYCNTLDYTDSLDTLEEYDECKEGQLSLSTKIRYQKWKEQLAAESQRIAGSQQAEPFVPTGQCRFDSDCSPICEGNVFWKRGCDAQTNSCKNTFDTPCIKETVAELEFQQLCTVDGCIRNTKAIELKIDELTQKGNQYTKDMQRITEYQLIATKRCLSALEDVTNKLIVDTATAMASPLPSLADIGAARTLDAIEKLTETKMSAEEFIALHCSLEKSLGTDFKLVEKKRDMLIEQIRELRAAT